MARRAPLIPVEGPPVLHLEQRLFFIQDGTAVPEYTPDVAEIANVAGKRVVVEVLGVVIALVDGDVAYDHHRFAVSDIRVRGQCVHEILDVSPDGYGILVLRQFGRKRATRSHKHRGKADGLQEQQSQARVRGGLRHTLCQVRGSHEWLTAVHVSKSVVYLTILMVIPKKGLSQSVSSRLRRVYVAFASSLQVVVHSPEPEPQTSDYWFLVRKLGLLVTDKKMRVCLEIVELAALTAHRRPATRSTCTWCWLRTFY